MIDLGVVGRDAVPVTPARARRPPLPWPPRSLTLLVVLAAALLGLGGGAVTDSGGRTVLV